jgi:ParB family chromosome partitioning protein
MTTTPSLRAFDELAANRRQQRGTPIPQLALDQIGPLPGQPRQSFDEDALNELAESIKAHGVIQPIIVIARKDVSEADPVRYRIVCGERRYQAARRAGLNAIPALVRDYQDDEVAVLALLENLQREDLTPVEEAEYLMQLKQKFGFTEEQLGERLGKSRDYVHGRTRLLNLQEDVLEVLRREPKRFTPSHAIYVNQLAEPAEREALIGKILSDDMTVAATRDEVKAPTRPAAPRTAPTPVPAGIQVALEDLAIYQLVARLSGEGATTVDFQAVEEALKKDAGWMRKLRREVLSKS